MPGQLLHQGATVICAHAGQAQPTVPFPRVRLGGQAVVTQSTTYTVSACPLSPPPTGTGPCVTAQWVTGAIRLRAGGTPVLLTDSQSICVPTGTPLTPVGTQPRVKGQ
jgi:hypothetical protein